MKYIVAVLTIYLAVVSSQSPSRPPPPPGTSTQTTQPQKTSPPRPRGCSPGCGPTEICAELGAGYCKGGSVCSVCIKMSSIRFPASALAGMFSQQQKQQQQQQQQQQTLVTAQQMPMQQPAFGTGQEEISLLELASHQKKIQQKISSEYSNPDKKTLPPRPPPADDNMVVRPVNEIDPVVQPIGGSPAPTDQDPFAITTPEVKYPIVATVHDPTANIHEAPIVLDRGQLDQIHQQYQQGNVASAMPAAEKKPTQFDFESFKRYQTWMKQQNLPADMSMAEEYAQFQKYTEFVKQQEKEKQMSQNSVSQTSQNIEPSPTMESATSNATSTLPPFDFAAFKSQFGQDLAPVVGATDAINSPTVQPPSGPEAQYYDYATLQRMWQQQQQQLNQVYQLSPNSQTVPNAQNIQNVQNTAITYDPQPPVNTYHDPFDIFGFNDPLFGQPAQPQANMFDLMLLDGMGMGMGFGFGF
ncbi:hypothetical protein ACF0H5_021896 [Mactra antiquata]